MRTAQGILAFVTLVMLLPMPSPHIRAQAGDVIDDPEMYAVYASVLPAQFIFGGDVTRVAALQETRAYMRCLPQFGPDWDAGR